MKKLTAILLTIIVLASNVYASSAGTTLADFLKLEVDARASGMGFAYTAVADGSEAVYWNPAGLGKCKETKISLSHFDYAAGINYENAAVAYPIGKGTLGCDIRMLYAEDERRSAAGDKIGTFGDYNSAFTAAYGVKVFDLLYCGAGIKAIHMKLDDEVGTAFAVDIGALYSVREKLDIGVSLRNIGDRMRFAGDDAPLPATLGLGLSYKLMKQWITALDLKVPFECEKMVSIGTEYRISNFLPIRAGYKFREYGNKLGGLDGISLGVGFKIRRYSIDYAFVPIGEFDTTHRVTLSITF